MNISILGAGSFGTSIAVHLAQKEHNITLWSRDESTVSEINNNRTNLRFLKDVLNIPANIKATDSLEDALSLAECIILAVPSQAIDSVTKSIKPYLKDTHIIVNLAKGLNKSSLERLSVIIQRNTNSNNVATLSGPSHAEEIVNNIPTTLVISSENESILSTLQEQLSTHTLRIYTNPDLVGVELGGASKNIFALASGILDGLGYGDNAKAALMVRGMSEIISIGTKLGAKEETLNGLSGMGDLIVTCTSDHSRNKKAGILLAKGYSIEETLEKVGMVVEGIHACECFKKLGDAQNVELPITNALYNILFDNIRPQQALRELLNRDRKSEF